MLNDKRVKMKEQLSRIGIIIIMTVSLLTGCAAISGKGDQFRDQNMDFGSIKTVAVLPLANQSRDQGAVDRVRDVLTNMLLETNAVYVLPAGEVARGVSRAGMLNPTSPSVEEVKKLGTILQVNAVITGAVREYGEVRAGSATANVISLSLQMIETQAGRVVWSASATKGGITSWDRLFGGGGAPMNDVTEKAVNDLIEKLF